MGLLGARLGPLEAIQLHRDDDFVAGELSFGAGYVHRYIADKRDTGTPNEVRTSRIDVTPAPSTRCERRAVGLGKTRQGRR